jgi:hypothetical protein
LDLEDVENYLVKF